ncbi:MAG TPA: DUF1326 domain-containing protein [Chloroflexia bacterium]|nr:DUF1326 domain-containing protein [Chloroflexia bacterium]
MAYHVEGRLLEVCTCGSNCPCRAQGEPDGGNCEAVNAWHIQKGTVDGVDVSGLTLIALSHVHGHVLQGRPVLYCVDDKATDAQQTALLSAWTGKQGGPLADMAILAGDMVGVQRAPMKFSLRKGKGRLQVGEVIEAHIAGPGAGQYGMTHLTSDICTTGPGEETHPAQATDYRVTLPDYGFLLDLHNHPVMEGRFRFKG